MADETGTGSSNEPIDDFNVPLDDDSSAVDVGDAGGGADDRRTVESDQPALASTLPDDLVDALYREGLRPEPGESESDAYSRLTRHLRGRSTANHREAEAARKRAEAAERRAAQFAEELRPMLQDYHRNRRQREVEEAAAQIPPKDSPEYAVWLQEETLRRLDEKERQEADKEKTEKQRREEQAIAAKIEQIDEAGFSKVAAGLGLVDGTEPDVEFAIAYDVFAQSGINAARHMFPTASDDEIREFIALSQKLDIRRAEMNGLDIREVMKSRLNGIISDLEQLGMVTRVRPNGTGAAAASTATASGNGDGQPERAKPAATSAQPPRQTTAQRVAADAQAAARRGPAAVASVTRPSVAGSVLPDPDAFDDDEAYAEAALAGLLGGEEQRARKHQRDRR